MQERKMSWKELEAKGGLRFLEIREKLVGS